MSTTICRHRQEIVNVQAEIAATQVYEHAAEVDHDEPSRAWYAARERQLWDTLAHFNDLELGLGGGPK